MGCKNVMFKHKCGSLAFAGCANGVRITISGYDYVGFYLFGQGAVVSYAVCLEFAASAC